ncbi:Syx1A [Bugula neritina]|uniref:Syx1A n=1 Tax=Bugula neritina TaxID=10212 RepID=A0A7J7KK53_BUGNE|nr:Syx1A [Bugula neritina]
MTKDRLAALKPLPGEDDCVPEVLPQTNIKVEDDEGHMIDKFFHKVEEVSEQISTIEENVKKVKAKHGEILADPNTDNELKAQLNDLMNGLKKTSNAVRSGLQSMKQELERDEHSFGPDSAGFRIKQTQCNTLTKKFIDAMNEYNEYQVTYRQKCKERIRRQLAITGKDTTDDELEDMIESGDPQIFTQGLENSIRELHEVFVQMAVLVENQGEMIDRIEFNVNKSVDHVVVAKDNARAAVVYQSKARRKKICIISIVVAVIVIILIIIIVPVVVSNINKKDDRNSSNNP